MEKSKNEKVRKFLEEMNMLHATQFELFQKLRAIVFEIYPNTDERIMYGGIMFSLEDDFGGLFARKKHISFEFSNGLAMHDPKKLLEGTGKFRRHLKLRALSDIEDKDVEHFVKQAV